MHGAVKVRGDVIWLFFQEHTSIHHADLFPLAQDKWFLHWALAFDGSDEVEIEI